MVATSADIADALVVGLDAQTFDPWEPAKRRYLPEELELDESQGLLVFVIPGASLTVPLSIDKGNVQTDYTCYVLLWKKLGDAMDTDLAASSAVDPEACDPLVALAESIRNYLLGGTFGGAWCIGCEFQNDGNLAMDSDARRDKLAFLSFLKVSLRAME